MTTFFDKLGEQLVAAGDELSRPAHLRRSRFRSRRGGALALAFVVLGGSALAATQPWQPSLGRPAMHDVPSGTSSTALPASAQAILGVLRRSPTMADHSPAAERLLSSLGHEVHGVRTQSVRLVPTTVGDAVVVSVERVAGETSPADTLANPICLLVTNGASCGDATSVTTGRFVLMAGPDVYGLVPDGVASVEVRFADGQTRTADVEDNLFAINNAPVTSPDPVAGAIAPPKTTARPTITWMDSSGNVVGPRG